jgi:hypothetical protein
MPGAVCRRMHRNERGRVWVSYYNNVGNWYNCGYIFLGWVYVGNPFRKGKVEMTHAKTTTSITASFCGDPPPGRSALDGWQQRGVDYPRECDYDRKRTREKLYRGKRGRGVGKRNYEKRGAE